GIDGRIQSGRALVPLDAVAAFEFAEQALEQSGQGRRHRQIGPGFGWHAHLRLAGNFLTLSWGMKTGVPMARRQKTTMVSTSRLSCIGRTVSGASGPISPSISAPKKQAEVACESCAGNSRCATPS